MPLRMSSQSSSRLASSDPRGVPLMVAAKALKPAAVVEGARSTDTSVSRSAEISERIRLAVAGG